MMERDNTIAESRYSLLPYWGFISAQKDHSIKRLIHAIIIQAARDALVQGSTGTEAQRWLLSEDCALYCEFTGINFLAVKAWVRSGCPDWRLS